MKRLEAIKKRCAEATNGPWMVDCGMVYLQDGDSHFQHVLAAGMNNPYKGKGICNTSHCASIHFPGGETIPARNGKWEDAQFIAKSRTDLPLLVECVESLLEELEYAAITICNKTCRYHPIVWPDPDHSNECKAAKSTLAKVAEKLGGES